MKTTRFPVITGPTASGKTALAVHLCRRIQGEIISVDSRQVYRGMDLGTGKDLDEYVRGGEKVPYHLINVAEPGEKYHVSRFQKEARRAVNLINKRGKTPVYCGGTGLYLEAVMEAHQYTAVPVNQTLRDKLQRWSKTELISELNVRPSLPFQVDKHAKKRLIRAIEIQVFLESEEMPTPDHVAGSYVCFLVDIPREERRRRISNRLLERIDNGLIQEVESLLTHVSREDMLYYGLEYKYVTHHLTGDLSRDEMIKRLETEIHRFAKRQMTWFRRMERKGITLHPIDGLAPRDEQLKQILKHI